MNPAYDEILAADDETRAGLFNTTAQRIGTTPQNVEKDFWVCWTLDALFNGLPDGPRLLFKGGTSLSKGFGLIRRFSEDIDVTVFRDDLGEAHSVDELQKLSGKKRQKALDAIREACEAYIGGPLFDNLTAVAAATAQRTGIAPERLVIKRDKDLQTLLVQYPSATPTDGYVDKLVRIESGAKSALDPNSRHTVQPYLSEDVRRFDLTVPDVTIVDAERTFWDKVVILHGLRRWFDSKGSLRQDGHRISRHYYDIHQLLGSDVGPRAVDDLALGADCVAHARIFFHQPAFDLASAQAPTFALTPEGDMYAAVARDYDAMRGMIFGSAPTFAAVIESVAALEAKLNGTGIPS